MLSTAFAALRGSVPCTLRTSHAARLQLRRVGSGHARGLERPIRAVASSSVEAWEPVIGLETHVQLNTATKAFCGCRNAYGGEPNTNVCPVCLGLPGSLPVLNEGVLHKAVLLGHALGCRVARASKFDRKQYFYPDLPKGYQISQYDQPLAEHGVVEVALPAEEGGGLCRVRITRAHVEEDSGKLVHVGAAGLAGSTNSLADYNRAGTPLVEIVSEPDLRSGREAAAYGAEIQRLVRFLGVSDGNMSEGSLRCDVNVSVRRKGDTQLGTKVEIKNMNSFAAMARAIDFEVNRQVAILSGTGGAGGTVVQETRLWEEGGQRTVSMRTKEGLADYRYFPEPDLPTVHLTQSLLDDVLHNMPELPAQVRKRYAGLGLPLQARRLWELQRAALSSQLRVQDTLVLADSRDVAAYYDDVVAAGADPKVAANWVMGEIMAHLKQEKAAIAEIRLSAVALAELLALIAEGAISGKIAKDILPTLLQDGGSPRALVEAKGLLQISDTSALEALVQKIVDENPKQVEEFRGGREKLKGFFVGQIMKSSGGRANPAVVDKLLMARLRG